MTDHERITVICFGMEYSQLRKQPWHSVFGIASGLQAQGFAVSLVTDVRHHELNAPFPVEAVEQLYVRNRPSTALLAALSSLRPDRILVLVGTQELLRPTRFEFSVPVALLLANQRFSFHELSRIRPGEWLRDWNMLKIPLVQSLIPSFMLRKGVRHANVAHLVYFSEASQKRHASAGLSPGTVIHPRVVSAFDSALSSQHRNGNVKVFCYFGSALTLRGVKDVITAFIRARNNGMKGRLELYIRVDDSSSAQRASALKDFIDINAGSYHGDIGFHDSYLSEDELGQALRQVDIFVLPFKITVSDVPLVIIEAALSGKPVISLDTPGVSEWREKFPNVVVGEIDTLWEKMRDSENQSLVAAVADTALWTDWKAATQHLANVIRKPLDCTPLLPYRMVCLIGVDGCGKTTLLNRLSEHMGVQNQPHGYIWSRFRNYFSKPLLGMLRLTGHNRKIVHHGVRVGIHDFSGSPLISRIFLLLQKWDMRLDLLLRYQPRLKQGVLLSDRCLLDTLVDLAVDTGMEDYVLGNYGKKLLEQLPQPALVIMVERDSNAALHDRPDIAADQYYAKRLELYHKMAARFGIPVLRNDRSIDQSLEQLCLRAQESSHA